MTETTELRQLAEQMALALEAVYTQTIIDNNIGPMCKTVVRRAYEKARDTGLLVDVKYGVFNKCSEPMTNSYEETR